MGQFYIHVKESCLMLSGVVMEQIVWFVCGIYYPSLGIGETIIAALELSV